ncbi:MAG: hypothetical protein VXW87_00315, partial [Pseudomonadota bacterium]|nr:hypothetical protein [Pseudomonadota bacterium]
LSKGDDEAFIESQVAALNSLPEETYEALQETLLRFKSLQALTERWDQDSQIFRQLYKCCSTLKALDVNEPLAEEIDGLEAALTGVEREITYCLEQHADSLFELSDIKEKISRYNDMGRKHRCLPKDLQSIHESLQSQLLEITQAKEEQESIIDEVKKAETVYASAATEVMIARKSQSDTLSETINRSLVLLGMDQAIFRVNWQDSTPCFEIQSNPGQTFKPIGECLSGGELSRLNLLILLYLGDSRPWILDEIDTGVSGVTGFKIRSLIAQIAQTRQVICISHLAQVSAGASTHFLVDKNTTMDKMVKSEIIKLSGQDRLKELARLMCGIVDQETVENAKQLID